MRSNWKIETFLIISFLVLCIQKENAQILIGPTIGLNWSAFSTADLTVPSKSSLGSSFGVIAEFSLVSLLSFRVEPSYIQKGSNEYWPDMGGPDIVKLRLQYFQIPVELQANLPISVFSSHIFIGPNIGYLLSANHSSTHSKKIVDVLDYYNKFDCSLDFGAGLEYNIVSLIKGNLDYKYSLGLLNIRKTGPIHTRGIQIVAGILFSI